VQYRDGDAIKRVELVSLLQNTGTHAFIVVRDDKLLYEAYFNGCQRDAVNISRSIGQVIHPKMAFIFRYRPSQLAQSGPSVNVMPRTEVLLALHL
jgi:hypothetical protein